MGDARQCDCLATLQKKQWSIVKWLLNESSKNLLTRLDVTNELIEALTFDAPLSVISLLVEASSNLIAGDAVCAWNAGSSLSSGPS